MNNTNNEDYKDYIYVVSTFSYNEYDGSDSYVIGAYATPRLALNKAKDIVDNNLDNDWSVDNKDYANIENGTMLQDLEKCKSARITTFEYGLEDYDSYENVNIRKVELEWSMK